METKISQCPLNVRDSVRDRISADRSAAIWQPRWSKLVPPARKALARNAPTAYITAAHTVSQLAEAAGDRLGAHKALAAGSATVADLPHQSLVRAAFEPALKAW